MDLDEFKNIPDYSEAKELKYYFSKVLREAKNNDHEVNAIANALYELADRQWHTYELLDSDNRYQIEEWIEKTWNVETDEYVEIIISIMAYLGLTNSFELLKKSIQLPMKESIRIKILAAISELRDSVNDPFSGMR